MNCPKCGQFVLSALDMDAVEDWGCCLGCDHIEGEANEAEKEEDDSLT